MLKRLSIGFLVLFEVISITLMVILHNIGITTIYRAYHDLQQSQIGYISRKLLFSLLMSGLFSVVILAIYVLHEKLFKQNLHPYKTTKIFCLQWAILFCSSVMGMIIHLYLIYNSTQEQRLP